jgi:sugar/nucleoside kinase (ribokinase family)
MISCCVTHWNKPYNLREWKNRGLVDVNTLGIEPDMAKIVVFGAVQIDVCAYPIPGTERLSDRPGAVYFSIGGTGYNISHGLLFYGQQASLFSHLPAETFLTKYIREKLRSAGIDDEYIVLDSSLPDGGFVGIFEMNELKVGISSCSVEGAKLNEGTAARAIVNSDLVVIDCNLSASSIEQIALLSWKNQKRVVVAGVSSAKVHRYLEFKIPSNRTFQLVGINKQECEAVCGVLPDEIADWNCDHLCTELRCSNLLVSLGASGHVGIDASGSSRFFAKERGTGIWTLGAGDALLAAHCAILASNSVIDWKQGSEMADRLISHVMEVRAAT